MKTDFLLRQRKAGKLAVVLDQPGEDGFCISPEQTRTAGFCTDPRGGELRTQKLKSHLMRTQSLKVLLLKPGVGQYIAMHATLTARDFFLANFYPSSPFTCIFSKPLPSFSCVSCG